MRPRKSVSEGKETGQKTKILNVYLLFSSLFRKELGIGYSYVRKYDVKKRCFGFFPH